MIKGHVLVIEGPLGAAWLGPAPCHAAATAGVWHKHRAKLQGRPASLETAVWKGKPGRERETKLWLQPAVAVTSRCPLPWLASGVTHTAPAAETREGF